MFGQSQGDSVTNPLFLTVNKNVLQASLNKW